MHGSFKMFGYVRHHAPLLQAAPCMPNRPVHHLGLPRRTAQDRTAMTIGELRAAKEKKESMLKSSMRECVVQAEGGADQPIAAQ